MLRQPLLQPPFLPLTQSINKFFMEALSREAVRLFTGRGFFFEISLVTRGGLYYTKCV